MIFFRRIETTTGEVVIPESSIKGLEIQHQGSEKRHLLFFSFDPQAPPGYVTLPSDIYEQLKKELLGE